MASDSKKVYYIGKDMGYAKNLRDRYKKFTYIDGLEFIPYANFDPADYQKLFCELIDNDAKIVYLDFTSNSDEFVSLANLLTREFSFSASVLVLLLDDVELLPAAKLTNADFIHFKHGEHHDVAYDPVAVAFPKLVPKLDFAVAKFKQNARVRLDVLISYITPTECYIETNAKLGEGELIELDHNIPSKVLKSKKALVKKVITSGLVYDYKFGYLLSLQILDEPEFSLEEEEAEDFEQIKAQKVAEYNELLVRQKKVFHDWVADQANFSSSNYKVRVLIFDEYFSLFKHGEGNYKKYPFSVRFQSTVDGVLQDVARFRPDIITMQFDPLEVEEEATVEENEQNSTDEFSYSSEGEGQSSLEKLTQLMHFIKEIEGYSPYIIVCNTKSYSSEDLKSTFKYPYLMVNHETIHYDFLKKISMILQSTKEKKIDEAIKAKVASLRKADPKKYARLRESDLKELRFYVDKRSEFAYAYIWHDIKIFEMSESEVSIACEQELQVGTRVAIDFPMTIQVRLIPADLKRIDGIGNTWNLYHGLICSIHELQKQKLRQFVNKIFFSDLDEKRAKEQEEYKRIQEEAMLRRKAEQGEIDDDEESAADEFEKKVSN